jgi:NAD-dependent dihydropyrimidine dehydrogenase PreA subunit
MKHKYLKNVTTLTLETEKCVGCMKCTEVCPHGVFEAEGDVVRIVEKDLCMECGACALNCPVAAINVNAGVGCAFAIIIGWFTGKEPNCGGFENGDSACC